VVLEVEVLLRVVVEVVLMLVEVVEDVVV